jgi:hypothetical protein
MRSMKKIEDGFRTANSNPNVTGGRRLASNLQSPSFTNG